MDEKSPVSSIADVVEHVLLTEDFTASYKPRVLAALRKFRRMTQYGQQPLELIAADLEAFDRLWGRGKVTTIPSGFKTVDQFSTWRSEARSGLKSFSAQGSEPPDVLQKPVDDWTTLRVNLTDVDVAEVQLIGVDMVINGARQVMWQPCDVTQVWLLKQYLTFDSASKRRAFKLGWELIQKHQNAIDVELPQGLPFAPMRKPREQAVRSEMPPKLQEDLTKVSLLFAEGVAGGHRRKHRKQVKENTITFYLRGITYLHTACVTLGHFGPDENVGLSDMANESLIERIIEAELDGAFPWEKIAPSTLYAYVCSCKLAFRRLGLKVEWMNGLLKDFTVFENIKLMSSSRRAWCAEFMQNKSRQRAFFMLPQTLFNRAKPQIAAYRNLNETKKKQALCWAISAAAAAILTSIPLRISTLLALDLGGDVSTVDVRGKGKDVMLTVAGSIVKNDYAFTGVNLTPKLGGNPKEILTWFMDCVRPLILKDGISERLCRPDQLFCGINDERMRRIWVDATLYAGVDMTPHMVRHALATIMANESDPDISLIAALLGDTEATVRKNYIFVEQGRKHLRGQEELSRIQKNILGKAISNADPRTLVGER